MLGNTPESGRLALADLLKGVAVLLMIQVHLMELFAHPDLQKSTLGNWSMLLGSAPVAPVFLIGLGYFAFSVHSNALSLAFRGMRLFLLGMLLNAGLNINLMMHVQEGLIAADLKPYIFGADVLHLAGLTLLIFGLLQKLLRKSYLFTLLMIGIVLLGSFLLNNSQIPEGWIKYLMAYVGGAISWSYYPLFPWLTYPLIGIVLKQLPDAFWNKIASIPSWVYLIALISLFFITGNYAFTVSNNLPLYYHHDVLFFLWTMIFLLFYAGSVKGLLYFPFLLPLRNFLQWLGKNVTLVYVVQWLIIGNWATEIFRSVIRPEIISAYYLFIVGISCMLSFGLVKIGKRLQEV